MESYSSYSDTQDTSDDDGMSLKQVLIKKFENKIAKLDNNDGRKPIYQSVIDNIKKENASELCEYFGIITVQEAKYFVANVKISW